MKLVHVFYRKMLHKASLNEDLVNMAAFLSVLVYKMTKRIGYGTTLIWILSCALIDPYMKSPKGLVDIYSSRFKWKVRMRYLNIIRGFNPEKLRGIRLANADDKKARMRIAIVGQFRGLIWYTKELFDNLPSGVDYYIYEIEYCGNEREYFESKANICQYERYIFEGSCPENIFSYKNVYFGSSYIGELTQMSESIIRSDVDVVLYVGPSIDYIYDLMNRVGKKIFIQMPTGTEVICSEWMSKIIHGQPQYDFGVCDDKLYDLIMKAPFVDTRAYSSPFFYNSRNMEQEEIMPWRERCNQIVYWGSLYKLGQNRECLDAIAELLRSNPEMCFKYWGYDTNGKYKSKIQIAFQSKRVLERCHYQGHAQFGNTYADKGWVALKKELRKSKLSINPWPIGGSASVVESYLMGIPSIIMSSRENEKGTHTNPLSYIGVEGIEVEELTVASIEAFNTTAKRIFEDPGFAEVMSKRVRAKGLMLTDPKSYWDRTLKILSSFEEG